MLKWLLSIPPKVGSIWALEPGNPFDGTKVKITAVSNGWVQYVFKSTYRTGWNTEWPTSLSIRDFRFVYQELKDEDENC